MSTLVINPKKKKVRKSPLQWQDQYSQLGKEGSWDGFSEGLAGGLCGLLTWVLLIRDHWRHQEACCRETHK